MNLADLGSTFPPPDEATWRRRVEAVLKGGDIAKRLTARTVDGVAIPALSPASSGAPRAARAVAGAWRVAQRVDLGDPGAAAAQALDDLENGADALLIVPRGARSARGLGLAVETVDDLDRALAGVALDLIATRIDPSPAGRVIAALVAGVVERRGLDAAALDLSFGLDPHGTLLATGRLEASEEDTARRIGEAVTELRRRGFRGPFLVADGRRAHEAGASEAEELGLTLAHGVAYWRLLEGLGLTLEEARAALAFTLAADADQFLGIAKFRAMRLLWARVEEASGLAPAAIRLDAETSWRMLTRRDPWTNIMRGTIAAFAAGIGGADSVVVSPFTAALGQPDGFARRIARNTQLVLIEEAHLGRVVDPAAGSGGLEALTQGLCERAWAFFQEIEKAGGIVAAARAGLPQTRIAATAAARAAMVATRRLPLTGTSEFPNLAEAPVAVLPEPAAENPPPRARAEPAAAEARLDFAGLARALAEGRPRTDFAPTTRDSIPCDPLPSTRLAEPFEALRDASDRVLAETGSRPSVFLATLGPLAEFTPRATFARNFFEAGGFAVAAAEPGAGIDDVARSFAASGAALACLCGSDDRYASEAEAAARALVALGARVWLAGRPADETALRAAGIEAFVGLGTDVPRALAEASRISGVMTTG